MTFLLFTSYFSILHMLNDRIRELRAFHFFRTIHQTGKVIGDGFRCDRAFHAFDDQIRNFGPAHVAEHHLAGENHRTGIHFIKIRILRRGAMRRFEDGVTRHIVDIRTWGNANPTDLRGESVREIVTVQR